MRTPPHNTATSVINYVLFLLLALLSVAGASSLIDANNTYFKDRHMWRLRNHNAPCAPLVNDWYGGYQKKLSRNWIEMEVPCLVEIEPTLDASAIWSSMNLAVKRRIVDWLQIQLFRVWRATTSNDNYDDSRAVSAQNYDNPSTVLCGWVLINT